MSTTTTTEAEIVYAYTRSESRKEPVLTTNMPPLFDEPTTLTNFHKHVNWPQSILLLSTPLIGLYGAFTTELKTKTLIFSIIYYFVTGLGITAGYHRLWAHRSYQATLPVKWLLCLAGSGAFQGSIRWWSRGHRAHHRWTDSDKDPYAAPRGFFFSHFGWMLVNRPNTRIGYADVADLKADPIIKFQHKYYLFFAFGMAFLFPTLVAGLLWDDFRGGFFYGGVIRLVAIHHATFCVNSLAHFLGEQTFDDFHTPRDHWITALVTCGEGYHNFHHEFPQDYRNAIKFYQYDPTKWLIKGLSLFGLTYDLKKFPSNEIKKGQIQMAEKKLLAEKRQLTYGTPLKDLPIYTWEEFQTLVNKHNKQWILIEGILYDVEHLDHPGGDKYITAGIGKDVTTSFNGGVYNHSNGARNLLTSMRVGVLKNGMELMVEDPVTENKKSR
ncbi:stearoyl-CoA desaturase [Radiomyces spectabilis]|uniref:stearoyl-CoA desaturase n=1 Tax=Radiomyces spectabilis TaxID=64574 RepID=UPI00221F9A10|nr:stearoyl-CoA desaturase [Radiomyces spectabilis]KAI8388844.1 stearoyl-CoA desaturase [Radiomyces spectabilis]